MKPVSYQPINCDFYDILEAYATLKRVSTIVFMGTNGQRQQVNTRIINLFSKQKEEFMELEDGTILRLDGLISIDGQIPGDTCQVKY
jgi:Rho-binding antiterminator